MAWAVMNGARLKGARHGVVRHHGVSCAGIIGIKHRHNVVRDTLVDICYRSGISAGKEVDIGLDGGRLDVCVDLTGSSHLTQTGMVDFVPDRANIPPPIFKSKLAKTHEEDDFKNNNSFKVGRCRYDSLGATINMMMNHEGADH
nr:hypothetical protein [Tanacetum cinerariifolium]